MALAAGAEPFLHDDGPVGVLLLHGLTGSPAQLRPLALHLADAGLSVSVPRLPGHGTTWQDLAVCRWDDFQAESVRALSSLRERCPRVVVGGLGVGAALALRLAELSPDDVDGLVLLNPALELRRPSRAAALLLPLASMRLDDEQSRTGGYPRMPMRTLRSVVQDGWGPVRAELGSVHAPVLLVRSEHDRVVPPSSQDELRAALPGPDVTELRLVRSGHVAVLDIEADLVLDACIEFVHRVAPPPTGA